MATVDSVEKIDREMTIKRLAQEFAAYDAGIVSSRWEQGRIAQEAYEALGNSGVLELAETIGYTAGFLRQLRLFYLWFEPSDIESGVELRRAFKVAAVYQSIVERNGKRPQWLDMEPSYWVGLARDSWDWNAMMRRRYGLDELGSWGIADDPAGWVGYRTQPAEEILGKLKEQLAPALWLEVHEQVALGLSMRDSAPKEQRASMPLISTAERSAGESDARAIYRHFVFWRDRAGEYPELADIVSAIDETGSREGWRND